MDVLERMLRLEFEVPSGIHHGCEGTSAPSADIQHVTEAPDGSIWFAEWGKDRLGRVDFGGEGPGFQVPERVMVQAGGSVRIPVETPGELQLGSKTWDLELTYEEGAVVVEASEDLEGTYNVVISSMNGRTRVGRFVTVEVEAAEETRVPGPALAAVVALIAAFALSLPYRR